MANHMARISFLAYSDIHHGEYTNGLTEDDVMGLEDQVYEHAERLDVDFVVFGGDRFVTRNPQSHTRAAADIKMQQLTAKFAVFAVVGNHCRELKNAHSAHSMMHLPYLIDARMIQVASEAGVYTPPLSAFGPVEFHVIPAGQRAAWGKGERQTGRAFCIMLFHDIVRMSKLGNGRPAEHGMDPRVLDQPQYDLVLGGDNHVPQKLELQHTTGYYIGAPCQHNWGDEGQERGFMHVVLETGQSPQVTRIPSRSPRFIKCAYSLDDQASNAHISRDIKAIYGGWVGNIIKVTLSGDLKQCSKINTSKLEDDLTKTTGARRVTVVADPVVAYKAMIPELARVQAPEDDWRAYTRSGKLDIAGMDPDRIETLGLDILTEAREAAGVKVRH